MKRVVIGAAALVALAGCGSTVSLGNGSNGVAASDNGLGLGTTSSAPQTTDNGAGTTSGDVTPATGGSTATSSTDVPSSADTTVPVGATTTTSGGQTATGLGITATTIKIGLTYFGDSNSANSALGANIATSDPNAGMKALLDYINSHGGVLGRKLTVDLYSLSAESSTPYATEAEEICTHYTQDVKVSVVIDGTPAADARQCLAKKGVAVMRGVQMTGSLASNEYDPFTILLSRAYSDIVPSLQSQGWFGGWDVNNARAGSAKVKVGIISTDDPDSNHAVDDILIPALKAAGHAPDPADVVRITPPQGFSDDGAVVAAIQNAVLKFHSHGVTHVIPKDTNASLTLFFNQMANSQSYYPRLGGTSGNGWQALLSAGSLPKRTLYGAMGIGWNPLLDIPVKGTGAYDNSTRNLCFSIFNKAGMPAKSGLDASGQVNACDIAFFLRDVLDGTKGIVNLPNITRAVNALGSGWPSASNITSSFASTKHDGVGSYVGIEYQQGCGCFVYVGKPERFTLSVK
jgi:hypothetical protein